MKTTIINRVWAATLLASTLWLTGCATPASPGAMSVGSMASSKKFAQSLSVNTSGGNETSALGSSNISNEDLRAAIEDSVTKSALFKEVVRGKSGDYELQVTVSQLSKPSFGAAFTVDMEAGWSLVKTSDKSVAMRKVIKSTYTGGAFDSLVGTVRLRMAVEGAVRDNIKQGLESIAALNL